MLVEVRHFHPGRVRLFVPGVFTSGNGSAGNDPDRTIQGLVPAKSVQKIKANRHCASITIEYDHNSPGFLADLLNKLRRARSVADFNQGQAVVVVVDDISTAVAPARQYSRAKFPLALPTISFALSFFVGPAVVAVNVPLMLWNSRPIFRRAWKILRSERRLNVDFLDTLAISVSMAHGAFVTAGIIVWLVRLGDWIRDLTAARSKRAVGE